MFGERAQRVTAAVASNGQRPRQNAKLQMGHHFVLALDPDRPATERLLEAGVAQPGGTTLAAVDGR